MGAGKSSVGRALADRLGWVFEDLDDRIERREGRTVPEIFRQSGEKGFRRAESAAFMEIVQPLTAEIPRVVALGGGAFAQESNRKLIAASGLPVVFLDATVDELWRRCCQQAARDAVQRPLHTSQAQFRALYQSRLPHYAKASLRVETGGKPVAAIAADIAQALSLTEREGRQKNS